MQGARSTATETSASAGRHAVAVPSEARDAASAAHISTRSARQRAPRNAADGPPHWFFNGLLNKEAKQAQVPMHHPQNVARLHDVGKLVIAEARPLKPGTPTPGDRRITETHTTAGTAVVDETHEPLARRRRPTPSLH